MTKARKLADLGNVYDDGALSHRNLIINGAMQVAQRGTSFTRTTSAFTLDRMEWVMNTSTCVISQSTDVPSGQGFANSLKVSPSVANSSLSASHVGYLRYGIEGQDLQQLAKGTSSAKKVTLSFWFKTNKVGTYQVNLRDHDNTRLIGKTFTPAASGTWEKFELTFDGDTTGAFGNDANRSLSIGWWFAAGSTYTDGAVPTSWEALSAGDRAAGVTVNFLDSTSNELYITGVQLEVGSEATTFEHRSYGEELALCQRYFYKKSWTGSGDKFNAGAVYDTTNVVGSYWLPVPPRAQPSVSYSNLQLRQGNTAKTISSFTVSQSNTDANDIRLVLVSSGLTGGQSASFRATGTGHLQFDAEL